MVNQALTLPAMIADTVTNRTLLALGHTVTIVGGVHTVEAAPARAGKHGEITEGDWSLVAAALADSNTDSRDWCQSGEGWSIVNEALDIRRARTACEASRPCSPIPTPNRPPVDTRAVLARECNALGPRF